LRSLFKNLKTDYIDLYQIHWPCGASTVRLIEETMSALIELKQQGKIRTVVFLIFPPSWKKLPSTDASIAYNLLTLSAGS